MNIKTTTMAIRPNQSTPAASPNPGPAAEQSAEADDKVIININLEPTSLINKGAYGASGAVAGLGLGVVTGSVLGTLAGMPSLSTVGGAVGVLGGAASALAASGSDDPKQAVTEMGLSWGAGSLGALGGLYIVGGGLSLLAESTGNGWLGPVAPILGTVVGSVAGSGAAGSMGDSKVAKNLASAGAVSAGGTIGLVVGTATQGIFSAVNPSLATVATVAPFLGAAAGGGIGYAATYQGEDGEKINAAATTGFAAAAGYAGGMVVGGIAQAVGGSSLYTIGAPMAGAAIAGLLTRVDDGNAKIKDVNLEGKLAMGGLTAAGATLAGDVVGHGLSWVTGHSIYGQIGAIAGMANGGLFGAELAEVGNQHVGRAVFGTTAGVVGGAALGTALTALTGQSIWSSAAPVLGAAAGGLTALANSVNEAKE